MANKCASFDKSYEWCLCNKLTTNNDKTKFILFHTKKQTCTKNIETQDTGVMNIGRVKYFNYLGLIIDEKLNWHEQAENVSKSLLQFYGIFNHFKFYVSSNAPLTYIDLSYDSLRIAKFVKIHRFFTI